uniref:Cytochrome c oxidase subunit 5A, mitochondrial n=1 Tax=Cerebratulus lacteus TaxID=6221 RepID=A0A0P0AHV1_CERLA|nr:cytochrome c oxidase subunit Va [Cerebratulus lacteus]
MFRTVAHRLSSSLSAVARNNVQRQCLGATSVRTYGKKHRMESNEEFDSRYESFFNKPEIDGWELRKGINDLQGYDLVPEPRIISACLRACRRVNDYALAVRYLEAVRDKCGPRLKTIWPYIIQEIRPTLDELGISSPEEMGYDKPELALEDVFDMHG